jgi:predicted alpha/beta superfamily hydrolase
MYKFFIFLFILCSNFTLAQNYSDITIGKRTTIKSLILNSDREIQVYLPSSYDLYKNATYPVLYLLDGRKFFHSFSGAVAQLSSDATPQIPEMIIIAITSQDRVRDSSPTNSLIGYSEKEEKGLEVSGGADNFLKFIKKELIPFVDKNYRTNSYRTFVGYSFTGLPVLHSLFNSPETFNSYLAIDFSAWWDDQVTLKNATKFLENYEGPLRDVYLNTVDRVVNNVYPERYNTVWGFIQEFEKSHPESIGFDFKKYKYKEENHHTMPLISFIEGMKYIFRGYMLNNDERYDNPEIIKSKFKKLSKRLGYDIFLSEGLSKYYGYLFLYTIKDIDKAIVYFQYNTERFPDSADVWDSLAEAYKVQGNINKAIKFYKKALSLDPGNKQIRKNLKALML